MAAIRELVERAMRLHAEGQLAAAAALYREALDAEPLNFDALNLLGNILLRQGETAGALGVIAKALSVRPRSVEAQMNFGYALSQQDRLDEALASFRRAAEIEPGFAEAHNAIGMVSAALDRLEDAVDSYRRVIDLTPGSAQTHSNLGIALSRLGRLDEAEACHRRAIEIEPGTAEAHNNLGIVMAKLDRPQAAFASYRRAIEIEPEFAEGHNNLGVALGRLDRHEEALASYRRAIELDPDFAEAGKNLANTLSLLGRDDEALAAYRRGVELEPESAEAHANLGLFLLKYRRPDAAMANLRRAVAIAPESAAAHNGLGIALTQAQRLDDAITHYRRATAAEPGFADAHNNLGTALKMVGRIDEALQAIETAIRLAPKNPEFYLNLAESKRLAADDPHLAAMEELARATPPLPAEERMRLHFALGKALADLGRSEQSLGHLLSGNALKRRQIAYDEAAVLGRFERTRAVFTPDLMRARHGLGNPSTVPVFILGMPRSGTTLVEQILASHPEVFGAGELAHLADVVGRLGGGGFPEAVPALAAAALGRLGADYLDRIRSLAPAAARITDKMPGNFRLVGLIHLALPNARIIHCRRDPVDTCLSCFSLLFTGDQPHTYDLGELGRYYRAYDLLMDHWRGVLPPGVMLEVRYEDVVADLAGQARRIVAHCGLDWDEACLQFYKTERPVQTASVIQVRQPIYQSSIGRGRAHGYALGPLLAALRDEPGDDLGAGSAGPTPTVT